MRLASAFALVCLMSLCAGTAQAQIPQKCPLPDPTGFVNDYANVIDQDTKSRLETILTNLRDRAQIEFSVVTVGTTGDQAIFDYSLAVARCWKLGTKEGEKNGLLLLVAVEDRKAQPQVSRHLEGDLPDGLITTILRRTLPEPFKAGEYGRGISDAVQTLVATLADKRGFSVEGIDQRYVYRPEADRRGRGVPTGRSAGGIGFGACCLIAIVVFVLIAMAKGGGGRGRGGWGGGGGGGLLQAILLANLLGSLGGGGRRSGGWGGGSSGWGGGGGGGFGGFGGGGDFGGGGGPGVSW